MIPAFEGLFNCLIDDYIKSHLNTVFVQYSKTTLARQLQNKCQQQNVDLLRPLSVFWSQLHCNTVTLTVINEWP